jgi:hypothetical protein
MAPKIYDSPLVAIPYMYVHSIIWEYTVRHTLVLYVDQGNSQASNGIMLVPLLINRWPFRRWVAVPKAHYGLGVATCALPTCSE